MSNACLVTSSIDRLSCKVRFVFRFEDMKRIDSCTNACQMLCLVTLAALVNESLKKSENAAAEAWNVYMPLNTHEVNLQSTHIFCPTLIYLAVLRYTLS